MKTVSLLLFTFTLILANTVHASENSNPTLEEKKETVLVVGATGRVGKPTLIELKKQGYQVRGTTRNLEKAKTQISTEIEWFEADALKPDTLTDAMRGVDRVICTIGVSSNKSPVTPEELDYGGVKNVIDAASKAGVKQFVLISSIGASHRFHLLNLTLNNVLKWKRQSEEYLRASDLDYTIIRPGGLRKGKAGLEDVVLVQGDRKGGRHVIIDDIAVVSVATLNNADAMSKTFEMLSDSDNPPGPWRERFKELTPDTHANEFQDCDVCPRMVKIPKGSFYMGSDEDEAGRTQYEGPRKKVKIKKPFAAGKFEITFDDWAACVADGACRKAKKDEGWGRGKRPVIFTDWKDTQKYLKWLSEKSGYTYRLLSEAEWEYAARAGSEYPYSWGQRADHNKANFGNATCCSGAAAGRDKWENQTAPVGSFPPNAFGLYDMHGNVYERVSDCWNPSHEDSPRDGSPRLDGDCSAHIIRGGSWISSPEFIRAAERDAYHGYYRTAVLGFRVARDL